MRKDSEARAHDVLNDLQAVGVVERSDLEQAFWQEAGKLKAGGKVSIADCFAITLTNRTSATLLTSDHHELDPVAAVGVCPIIFIR